MSHQADTDTKHQHTDKCRFYLDLGIPLDESLGAQGAVSALIISSNIEDNIVPRMTASSAGAGFGFRDMQWDDLTHDEVTKAHQEIVAYLHECGYDRIWTAFPDDLPPTQPHEDNEPYVSYYCLTEEEEDPQYRQEILMDRQCTIYFDTGPTHDRTRVQCTKDDEWHYDETFGTDHVGNYPWDAFAHTATEQSEDNTPVVSWKGGGACSGDPLKTSNVNWEAKWPKAARDAYFKMIEKRLFPNG